MRIGSLWNVYTASPMYLRDASEKRRRQVETVWAEFAASCWSRSVKHMTSELIAEWLYNRCEGLSNKTYDEYLRILRQVIGAVLSKTGLTANPALEVPMKRKNSISRQPYTQAEIEAILHRMDEGISIPYAYRTHGKTVTVMRPYAIPYIYEVKLSLMLAAWCGMRMSDAVSVERSMYDGEFLSYTPHKTQTTSGKAVVVPVVYEPLRAALEACDGLLTPHLMEWHGHNPSTLSRLYHRIFEACGFQTRQECEGRRNASTRGFHCLRHSYATWCAEAGVPIEVTRDILGHTSVMTTNIYTHISCKMKAKELGKILGATKHG